MSNSVTQWTAHNDAHLAVRVSPYRDIEDPMVMVRADMAGFISCGFDLSPENARKLASILLAVADEVQRVEGVA